MNKELFKDIINAEEFSKYKLFNGAWTSNENNNNESYAQNYGLQWNKFNKTQFDSNNGTSNTRDRLFGCS